MLRTTKRVPLLFKTENVWMFHFYTVEQRVLYYTRVFIFKSEYQISTSMNNLPENVFSNIITIYSFFSLFV